MASTPLISVPKACAGNLPLQSRRTVGNSRHVCWRAWRGRGQAGLSTLKETATPVARGGAWSQRGILSRFGWQIEGFSGLGRACGRRGARGVQEGQFALGTGTGLPLLLAFSGAVAGTTRAHSFGPGLPALDQTPALSSVASGLLEPSIRSPPYLQTGKTAEGARCPRTPPSPEWSGAASEQAFCL